MLLLVLLGKTLNPLTVLVSAATGKHPGMNICNCSTLELKLKKSTHALASKSG